MGHCDRRCTGLGATHSDSASSSVWRATVNEAISSKGRDTQRMNLARVSTRFIPSFVMRWDSRRYRRIGISMLRIFQKIHGGEGSLGCKVKVEVEMNQPGSSR